MFWTDQRSGPLGNPFPWPRECNGSSRHAPGSQIEWQMLGKFVRHKSHQRPPPCRHFQALQTDTNGIESDGSQAHLFALAGLIAKNFSTPDPRLLVKRLEPIP